MNKLVECVPNFSEGRDMNIIKQITDQIETVEGVKLLDVDPGKATNRTVVTLVGPPDAVIEAAFRAVKKASEVIDMTKHKGEHARMGATDVCPLIPISGMSMEETIKYAQKLGKRIGEELNIPIYLYEHAASKPDRKNLATVRAGEYEGFAEKLKDPNWAPDFGKSEFNAKSGCTAVGARDFLIAYNVNLNTKSTRRANAIAFDIREAGRVERKGDPLTGEIVTDEKGEPVRIPGSLKSVKAVGWFIKEYDTAQISINLTNIQVTPVHIAFDEVCKKAEERGMRVTGSELVGLIPLQSMLAAGRHYLTKQQRSLGVSEAELVNMAISSMGLSDISEFDPKKKIIEYQIQGNKGEQLVDMNLTAFANETASESPAPGGGSISAYVGALGISLATMVANLSSHKRGWDDRWEEFSEWAVKGQKLKDQLLFLVDEDTAAFNKIMDAFGLPKNTEEDKKLRSSAIQAATKYAIDIPLQVMKVCYESMAIIKAMAEVGNPNSVSDAGVGALCARSAVLGAFLNVKINAGGLKDAEYVGAVLGEASELAVKAQEMELEILKIVEGKL